MKRLIAFVLTLSLSLIVFAQASSQSASVPRMLRFGGNIKSADGTPRTGVVGVMFSLYSEQQGGTALWTELQNVQLDTNGQYTVLLGSQHAEGVPAEVFTTNEARWLGIQVEADPEQPRVLLVSVPYALKAGDAETFGGKPLSAFLLNPNADASGTTTGTATTTQTTSSGVKTNSVNTSTSGGTANFVAKWIDATTLGNSLLYDSGSKVGIGTSTPAFTLDVVGGIEAVNSAFPQINFKQTSGTVQEYRYQIDADGAYRIYDITAGAPRFTLTQAGKVGVGTTTPGFSLDVVGGIEAVSSAFPQINFKQTSGTAQEYRYQIDADGAYRIYDITAGMPRFTLTQAGSVGIGTSTPGAKLEVNGSLLAGGIQAVSSAFPQFNFKQTAGTLQEFRYQIDADGAFRIYDMTAGALPRFTVTQAGNIGIGNSAPGQKLTVAGTVESTSGGFKFPDGSLMTSASNITGTTNYTGSTSDQIIHVTQNGAGAGSLTIATLPSAIRGDSSASTGFISGVLGSSASPSGFGVFGENLASSGNAVGTFGVSTTSTTGTGIWGEAESTTGATVGVYGKSASTNGSLAGGTGVLGYANSTTGDAVGVYGLSDSTTGTGVWGDVSAGTGTTFGVYGRVASAGGTAGVFDNTNGGNLLLGRSGSSSTSVFRVDSTGKGYFNGGTQTSGADFAESVEVSGVAAEYKPGDVLMIDSTGYRRLALASEPYSTKVAGIYSTKPGVLATPHMMDDVRLAGEVPLAVVGIVPCKVSTENGPIEPGDMLVSSSTPGYAMKGTDRGRMLGAVVGKAMQSLRQGSGVIEVLVSLH